MKHHQPAMHASINCKELKNTGTKELQIVINHRKEATTLFIKNKVVFNKS